MEAKVPLADRITCETETSSQNSSFLVIAPRFSDRYELKSNEICAGG